MRCWVACEWVKGKKMSREQNVAGHSHGEAEVMWRKAAVKLKGMREKGKGERERRDRRTIKGYGGGGRRR